MNLFSMTGFGRAEVSGNEYQIVVEIKSVNNRFKEMRFRLPQSLNALEINLKNKINDKFKRGTFDASVSIKRVEGKSRFDEIDQAKVLDFLLRFRPIVEKAAMSLTLQPGDLFRAEFQKEAQEEASEEISKTVLEVFDNALVELEKSRSSEGDKLERVLRGHLGDFEKAFEGIQKDVEGYQASVEAKLRKRFADWQSELKIDENRFMQEVVFYLEKLDVHEEINRLKAHIQKMNEILSKGQEVGRQIDFLIQEMGRETNTIGSKSNKSEISESVVQMKIQLEKMREQGLNLE